MVWPESSSGLPCPALPCLLLWPPAESSLSPPVAGPLSNPLSRPTRQCLMAGRGAADSSALCGTVCRMALRARRWVLAAFGLAAAVAALRGGARSARAQDSKTRPCQPLNAPRNALLWLWQWCWHSSALSRLSPSLCLAHACSLAGCLLLHSEPAPHPHRCARPSQHFHHAGGCV